MSLHKTRGGSSGFEKGFQIEIDVQLMLVTVEARQLTSLRRSHPNSPRTRRLSTDF